MGWSNPAVGAPAPAITSPYGPRKLAGAVSDFHAGADIRSKRSAVVAAEAGTVRTIWQTAKGAWVLDIQHAGNVRTRYIHMYRNEIKVAVGQKVSSGQHVGYSGASGTTAAHLHFEVMVGGKNVDPVPFMRERGIELGVGAIAPATPPRPSQEDDMYIEIAQLKGKPEIYVGNGVTRRHIPDVATLNDIRWRIQAGIWKGNDKVQVVDRIEWLGVLVKG